MVSPDSSGSIADCHCPSPLTWKLSGDGIFRLKSSCRPCVVRGDTAVSADRPKLAGALPPGWFGWRMHLVGRRSCCTRQQGRKNVTKSLFIMRMHLVGRRSCCTRQQGRNSSAVQPPHCSIWRPTMPAAVSATLISVSPMRAPCSRESKSTAPMASPSAMMGDITCAV